VLATSTVYNINVAVETDYELFQYFGSAGALTSYVGNLFGAISAIYNRDLKANLVVGYTGIYQTASDPWTATDSVAALYELGNAWHNTKTSVARNTVHLLSKKILGGGVAWLGTLCAADFPSGGNWGGGYGVTGNLNGVFSTTTPSLYWDVMAVAHEIG